MLGKKLQQVVEYRLTLPLLEPLSFWEICGFSRVKTSLNFSFTNDMRLPLMPYSVFFRFIHLFCALVVFVLIPLGFFMKAVDDEELLITLYDLHKSLGVLILAMVVFRIYMRVKTVKPTSSASHTRLERGLSHITHKSLYTLLLVMPVSGWLMSNAAGFPVSFFGLFELPDLVAKNDETMAIYQNIHFFAAFVLITLIMLHAAGALKHHFIDKDTTLKRISSNNLGKAGGILIASTTSLFFPVSIYLWVSGEGVQNTAHENAHAAGHASIEVSPHGLPAEGISAYPQEGTHQSEHHRDR
jgi:cytochrome b561